MQQETRLPRNAKEGALFGAIIVTLTVLLMASLNVILAVGEFNIDTFYIILKTIPVCWVIAMIIEPTIVGRFADKMVHKFTAPTDSFNAKILYRILFTVFGMSFIMTLVGYIIGHGLDTGIFSNFLTNWPRNFLIVLIAESLVIQPIARFVMVKMHAAQDRAKQVTSI